MHVLGLVCRVRLSANIVLERGRPVKCALRGRDLETTAPLTVHFPVFLQHIVLAQVGSNQRGALVSGNRHQ